MVKLIRFLFVCAVVLAIAGCGFAGVTIWYFGRELPDYQQLAHYQPPITTRVHAGDGRLVAEYATERRVFVPIQAIPDRVIDAFLSAEDKNFYNHHGIDPGSILRAAITDVGRLRGKRCAQFIKLSSTGRPSSATRAFKEWSSRCFTNKEFGSVHKSNER
jgi:penicillin-binding protein 1A